MKNNTVEDLIDLMKSYAHQYYLTAEENDSFENLKKKEEEIRTTLTQHHQDGLREVYREIVDLAFISKTHIEALAQTRGIDISDR